MNEGTRCTLHGKNIVHITQGSNTLHFFYDASNKPAIVEYNGAKYAYVHNLQGDIVAILDSNSNKVVEYKYDAWGKPISKTGSMKDSLGTLNPFRYRGYVYDEETALYYLRSRYHNPCHTRFINVDNHLGVICRLISHTAFTYCRNSPILYLDYAGTEETRFNCPQCRYMPQNEEFHYHVPSAIVSYDMSDYTLAHVTGDDVNVRDANCETTNMVTNTGDQWYVKIPDPSTYAGTSFVEVLITEGTARYARTGHISISFLFIPSTRLGYAHSNDSGRAGEINIRSSPEISKSNILRTIQNGQAAYIHAAIDGWYLISNEEGSGWVSSDYFTEIVASARSPQLTNCITSRFAMVCIY